MCLTEQSPQRREEAQFTSAPGAERSWIDRQMPSGDSIGAMSLMMPTSMNILSQIGTEYMGRPLAAAMRENPSLVRNVGGSPMMMLNGRPNAFSGIYGNKEPENFTAMKAMQQIPKAPQWQGEIPFFKDDISPAAAAVAQLVGAPMQLNPYKPMTVQKREDVVSGGSFKGGGGYANANQVSPGAKPGAGMGNFGGLY